MTLNHPGMFATFFGLPGWAELILVAFVGLLLFGKRLPDVARSLGQSIVEFKKGMNGVKNEFEAASKSPPNQPQNPTQALPPPSATPSDTESTQTAHPEPHSVKTAE